MTMATYKILYWQEVPSQIKADDGDGRNHRCPCRPASWSRSTCSPPSANCSNADDYLAQWKWSEEEERDGSAEEVAAAVIAELEAQADW